MPFIVIKHAILLPLLCLMLLAPIPLFSQPRARDEPVSLEPYWRQALGGEVLSLPHVQVQSAVVALDGGNIKAYSTIGTPLWNFTARGRISPFVTRSREGSSYISRTNGMFIAVNRAGRELWRRDLESPLTAKVVIGWDGRLFIPTEKKIFCYTASGNLLWIKTFESSFTTAPKLDRNGGILFTSENTIFRIDPFGNINSLTLSNPPSFVFLNENQQIVAVYSTGVIEIIKEEKSLPDEDHSEAQEETAPQEAMETPIQETPIPGFPARPLAAADRGNEIAAVLSDGRVTLVSVSERKILWTGNSHIREQGLRSENAAEIIFDDRGIYILSKSGATCFSSAGRRLWYTFLHDAAAVPAFGDDGILYSGGTDWILYAYKLEDRVLQQKTSIYGPVPEGSYGMDRPHAVFIPSIPLFENEVRNKLNAIRRAVNAGDVGTNEPEWVSFLMTLSSNRDSIVNKITSINLLGKLGSRETIPWLLNIFNRDNEPSVKAAAINAIGNIGVDPDGIAIQTFLFSVYQGSVRNEQILSAITSATGALCRFSGPPLSEMGIRLLNHLSVGNHPPIIKRQAERELISLK